MLVLSRRSNESIVFPHLGIRVQVLRLQKNEVRLGIEAPRDISILREEIAIKDGLQLARSNELREKRHALRNRLHTVVMRLELMSAQLEMTDEVGSEREGIQVGLRDCLVELAALDGEVSSELPNLPPSVDRTFVAENKTPFRRFDVAPRIPGPPRKSAWRALLVEDDENERELLAGIFRLNGFDVATAHDGEEALRMLECGDRPDIVLMDMHMPRMNGAEAISRVRENEQFSALPIMGVSGSDREDWEVPLGNGGVNCWFRKPVSPALLLEVVAEQLAALGE